MPPARGAGGGKGMPLANVHRKVQLSLGGLRAAAPLLLHAATLHTALLGSLKAR